MNVSVFLAVLCCGFGLGAANLQDKYTFSQVLLDENDQFYALHWNFNRSAETIYFAVNVSTTGWVGFGLSPNGQMPGSDVVMGWVAGNGETYFWDRYAVSRSLPVIDSASQDWFLTNSLEDGRFTVLEFSRNFTSCDPQDLNIASSTDRVVWSYSVNDPSDPSGSDARQHDYKGTMSINLIGGTPSVNTADLQNENFLDYTVTNVTIPSASTTYWCETFPTPRQFSERQHYINRFGPALTQHPRAFVHHIIVYGCPGPLETSQINVSMPCADFAGADFCRRGALIGGWAVGGEDFYFPEGIAFPIVGTGESMIEMHYDNPGLTAGVIDNSGMRFYYTTEAPQQKAGSLSIGHVVLPVMIIPPKSRNFTISGICTSECSKTFPAEGIRIFANNFHTHLAGHGLTIQHYRQNKQCNVLEELEPIDQNLKYDFNFQQTTILPKEHVVLPGDILALRCFYNTMDRTTIVQGGESTREEMCLSFMYYYPKPEGSVAEACQSFPNPDSSFNDFYTTLLGIDEDAAMRFADPNQAVAVLNSLDWENNPILERSLQESVTNSTGIGICYTTDDVLTLPPAEPAVAVCPYQPPAGRCGGPEPMSCCDRVALGGAVQVQASAAFVAFCMILLMMAVY